MHKDQGRLSLLGRRRWPGAEFASTWWSLSLILSSSKKKILVQMLSGPHEHLPGCLATCFSVSPLPRPGIAQPTSQPLRDGQEHVYIWD